MKFNVFTFGSRFFIETNGTAMGTNAACMYATIYYSYLEETVLSKLPFVKFYRRLIDDAFTIIDNGIGNFEELQLAMDNFGPISKRLEWVATKPSRSVDFLDLTVSINNAGAIKTRTFKKAMNLYLCLYLLLSIISITRKHPRKSDLRHLAPLLLAKHPYNGLWTLCRIILQTTGSKGT